MTERHSPTVNPPSEPGPAATGPGDDLAARLRGKLADELRQRGDLRSPEWREAVLRVPRHVFVPAFFQRTDGPGPTTWTPRVGESPKEKSSSHLEAVYSNTTLVTRLDGDRRPEDVEGPVTGTPTSSSTLPGLVVRMVEDSGVHPGDRVLEIGTGTGYSTALLCERCGDEAVTSVEYDARSARSARDALATTGRHPNLVVGDGLLGRPEGAPYDRLIATCSVRHVPAPWLEQVRSGGTLLVPLSGWLPAHGLVRLTRGRNAGEANGEFLPGCVSFMGAAGHAAPAVQGLANLLNREDAGERATDHGPAVLEDWTTTFLIQLAAPTARHLGTPAGDGTFREHLVDPATGSSATLLPDGRGGHRVRQSGPVRLWDTVEETLNRWERAGRPDQARFGMTVTGGRQWVWAGSPDGPRWELPTDVPTG
ncbi:ATP-grasp peptide maturase system methyltransferase [Streptomyces calidiresistens]|uniref:Protein-L-isoaspartate O-methyltransferase n=1 Tax=Streptomyces calidiresistens TaxID=1485586 RepID=A0A7W3XX46_9ACTN|nr:ATP-grasp peptide maturase system methyltransferase [Streptomyces calidiresistens]MBB0230407.1 methyltransferase domain-containing protein [Streptomyces calidiresistens]